MSKLRGGSSQNSRSLDFCKKLANVNAHGVFCRAETKQGPPKPDAREARVLVSSERSP